MGNATHMELMNISIIIFATNSLKRLLCFTPSFDDDTADDLEADDGVTDDVTCSRRLSLIPMALEFILDCNDPNLRSVKVGNDHFAKFLLEFIPCNATVSVAIVDNRHIAANFMFVKKSN